MKDLECDHYWIHVADISSCCFLHISHNHVHTITQSRHLPTPMNYLKKVAQRDIHDKGGKGWWEVQFV